MRPGHEQHPARTTGPRRARGRALLATLALVSAAVLAGCGEGPGTGTKPFALPVGETTWDAKAPAWLDDGTLHVGEQTVELGKRVDEFVLGLTGVYWTRGRTLWFTDAAGATQKVEDVGWRNIAVSADRSVFATVDQSRGPTDEYGAHVMQVAVFDTRTGEQLYRTPDEKPADDEDLGALYPELMPMLTAVSNDRVFFAGSSIRLADGSRTPAGTDAEGIEEYEGYAGTLFPDGYRVGLEGDGRTRRVADDSAFATGVLSPDRTTLFDVGTWPAEAVVYDARTGAQGDLDAPWDHFTLVGWTDDDTFFGVAELIDEANDENSLRARQVVSCETSTRKCSPVSPVIETDDSETGNYPTFLTEASTSQL